MKHLFTVNYPQDMTHWLLAIVYYKIVYWYICVESYSFVVGVAVGVGSSLSAALVTLRETWSIKPPTAANGAATIPNKVLLPPVVDSPADVKGSFVGWLGSAGVLGIFCLNDGKKKEEKRNSWNEKNSRDI